MLIIVGCSLVAAIAYVIFTGDPEEEIPADTASDDLSDAEFIRKTSEWNKTAQRRHKERQLSQSTN